MKTITTILAIILLVGAATEAETDRAKQLKRDYNALSIDLMNHTGEFAHVKDFVYTKDVATFTFEEGDMYLLRPVQDRPTTVVFVGTGRATIDIPPHVEKQSMRTVARDTVVFEEFETCLLRIGDDFDLAVKKEFTFEPGGLGWKHYNMASKQAQGEFFFKPSIHHHYDNHFQLLRSCYERGPEGYFWIDFNRYVYSYDPNRPEEVEVAFEFEGGDVVATPGARFQKQAAGIYDDAGLSRIPYPTTPLELTGAFEMAGLDGKSIEAAAVTLKLAVDTDSLMFLSTWLHYNLKLDSVHADGGPCDLQRRKDFNHAGIILPDYAHRGDTVALTYYYRGRQYNNALPYVDNPAVTVIDLEFTHPRGFDYFMPGMSEVEPAGRGKERFTVRPQQPFRRFYFDCYASGVDTVTEVSEIGLPISYLDWELVNKKYSDHVIPDAVYRPTIMEAFNWATARFNAPMGAFQVYVSPGAHHSMPGVMRAPQITDATEGTGEYFGGYNQVAGLAVGQLWFGPLMQPLSDRELWLTEAIAEYVNILFIQSSLEGNRGYSNLLNRRDTMMTIVGNKRDMPLAAGERAAETIRRNKGLWVLHMLRMMMYDLDAGSDALFYRFLYELGMHANMKPITNQDFVALAEKYCDRSLDSFFSLWLYGVNYPRFDVRWSGAEGDEGYLVDVQVETDWVPDDFAMPVIMRVAMKDGSSHFMSQEIHGPMQSFQIGPVASEPEEFVFGEFYSILCESKVREE